jgi:hypothetical protein
MLLAFKYRLCFMCFPTQRYCVRYVSTKSIVVRSSVCDHDATIIGNRTESKKVITHAVQRTICNCSSCMKKCELMRLSGIFILSSKIELKNHK